MAKQARLLGALLLTLGCGSDGGAGSVGADAREEHAPDGAAAPDAAAAADAGGDVPSGNPFTVSVLPSLDDKCGGGANGRQVLAAFRPPYAGAFMPPVDRKAPYAWTGSPNPSPLTVDVKYDGGTITCTIDNYVCPGGGVPCRLQQPPEVQVQVTLTLKTADGTLDESFMAPVRLTGGSAANWSYDLPATKIRGSYPITVAPRAEAELAFIGQIDGATYRGSISEAITGRLTVPGGTWELHAAGADASADR